MTQAFDVSLDLASKRTGGVRPALFVFRRKSYPGEYREYPSEEAGSGRRYARATASLPFYLKWKDDFEVQDAAGAPLGRGAVLNPVSEDPRKLKGPKRIPGLELLAGGTKDMILALAEAAGFRGVREKDILDFARLEPEDLEAPAGQLEEEGKVRILVFSPLFLLSQGSFDFLCGRILEFVGQFHEKHPESRGVAVEKVAKRFELADTVSQLALKHLLKTGKVQLLDSIVALADFKVPLSTQEEGMLKEMEKMCYDGKFISTSLEDVRARFKISPVRLQTLLSLLAEGKKIIQGKDGYYIHAAWLDELVRKLRESGKKGLAVADFKEMTGLSRKYAIPLLELLDEMGVTKRVGPGRIIL